MKTRTVLVSAVALVVVLFAAAQLAPFGPDRAEAPSSAQIAWPDERTRDLATRACMDCHSQDTRWPWYASVAPVSWIVADHVQEGRAAFDFAHPELTEEASEAGEVVREGSMPPWSYTLLHRDAVLSPSAREVLARGLEQMFGSEEAEGAEATEGDEKEKGEHDD